MEPSRISALILAVMLAMTAVVSAATPSCSNTCTFNVRGRKFAVVNRLIRPDEGAVCPEANPNTVTFCRNGSATIVGNFAAPDLGVCDPSVNPSTLPANAQLTYEQYGDQVILRIPGRVASAFRVLIVDGRQIAVGLSSQRYGVSTLTDIGSAVC